MAHSLKLNLALASALVLSGLAWSARPAQVPGFAEISRPSAGEALSAVVTIEGTASHPAFQAYAISFAYDPNPTHTWFPIGDRSTTPVSDGRLALWDTTGITPGTYQVRLTVLLEGGRSLEAIVGGLVIGGAGGGAASSEATALPPPSTQAASTQAANPIVPAVEAQPPTPGSNLVAVLKIGVFSAIAALALIGGYAYLRPKLRVYLGSLQTRRLHPRRRPSPREGRR